MKEIFPRDRIPKGPSQQRIPIGPLWKKEIEMASGKNKQAKQGAVDLHNQLFNADGSSKSVPDTQHTSTSGIDIDNIILDVNEPGKNKQGDDTAQRLNDLEKELMTERQRFLTLQGKYNSEVSRQAMEIMNLSQQVSDPSRNIQPNIEDAEMETFKEQFPELYPGVQAVSKTVASTILRQLENKLDERFIQLGRNQETDFFSDLKDVVPDWEIYNKDPNFNNWLDEYDPLVGTTKRVMLESAVNSKNPKRAAAFFKKYKEGVEVDESDLDNTQNRFVGMTSGGQHVSQTIPVDYIFADQIKTFFDRKRKGELSVDETKRGFSKIKRAIAEKKVLQRNQ